MQRIDVVEGPPTNDQLSNILEYLGPSKAGSAVSGASDGTDALRKFKASENAFQRPIVVDWNNGRAGTWQTPYHDQIKQSIANGAAVVGDNESEIMKLVRELPKEAGKA